MGGAGMGACLARALVVGCPDPLRDFLDLGAIQISRDRSVRSGGRCARPVYTEWINARPVRTEGDTSSSNACSKISFFRFWYSLNGSKGFSRSNGVGRSRPTQQSGLQALLLRRAPPRTNWTRLVLPPY